GERIIALAEADRASNGVVLVRPQVVRYRGKLTTYGTIIDLGEITDLRNTLATGRAQLAKANAALSVARNEYERVKRLYAGNQNVSEKTVQSAEGSLRTEEANVQAAQASLDAAQAQAQQRW